jgi:hypothetical protein
MDEVFQDTLGFFDRDKWFYYDESGLENGPFNTEEQAIKALDAYVEFELNWTEKQPILKMKDNMGL